MKVLLCSQYHGPKGIANPATSMCFPLGLACIASMLEYEGHDVFVFDHNFVENPSEELQRVLDKVQPDFVGVCLRNIDRSISSLEFVGTYYPYFESMLRLIKQRIHCGKIIVGGTGFSLFAREIMEDNPDIDYGVISHGEATVSNLLKTPGHPNSIKNLVWRRNGKIIFNGIGYSPNFDSLPPPSRKGFDMSKYKKMPFSVGVQSKRGCAFSCAHCLAPFFGGYQLELRSPEKVVDEIDELVNKYGIKEFSFVDSVFNYPQEHSLKICQEIIRRKLDVKWSAYFREDFLNAENMRKAIEAGCILFDIHIGGRYEALSLFRNKTKIKNIEETIDLISVLENAKVNFNFAYDLPSGNLENLLGITRLIGKMVCRCKDKISPLYLSRMRIYPHTPLCKIALLQGKISSQTDLLHPIYYKSASSKIQKLYISIIWVLSHELIKAKVACARKQAPNNR